MAIFGFGFIISDPDEIEIESVMEDVNMTFGMQAISIKRKRGKVFLYIRETSSKSAAFELAKKDKEQFHMELTPYHIQIADMASGLLGDEPEWHVF